MADAIVGISGNSHGVYIVHRRGDGELVLERVDGSEPIPHGVKVHLEQWDYLEPQPGDHDHTRRNHGHQRSLCDSYD